MTQPSGVYIENYTQDMAVIRTRLQWLLLVAGLVLLFTMPLYMSVYIAGLVDLAAIYIIAVQGLNIMKGYCGMVSIGQAAFMGTGAYAAGIFASRLGVPFYVAIPAAAVFTGIVGVIFGASVLKMKGFYISVASLAAQFILMWIAEIWRPVTGGADIGLTVPSPSIGGLVFKSNASMFYIIMVCLLVTTIIARNITRTKLGRAMGAVRDNETAAAVMGMPVAYTKLVAFFLGCAFAGVAGALFAFWSHTIVPGQFGLDLSLWFIVYIAVGGIGTTVGPFLGTIAVMGVVQLLAIASSNLGGAMQQAAVIAANGKEFIFGAFIVLILMFEPRGLAHRWDRFKKAYRSWPY